VGPVTSAAYPTSGGYCALWFNNACSAEADMLTLNPSAYVAATFVRDARPVDIAPPRTTTAAVATTTVLSEGLYMLKYPQQACEWGYFTEGTDWAMYLQGTDDPSTCAAGCLASKGCTGFEASANAGGEYASGPYCALWFNGACAVPDESFSGFLSGSVEVDTYTLVQPVDAFKPFENRACAWSFYEEGTDWAFADKTSQSPDACAKLCLDSTQGCTGFEVGASSTTTQYGDLSAGYCALWFNNSCSPDEFLDQRTDDATTYELINSPGCDYSCSHMYYFMLMAAGLMVCVLGLCCCRRAAIRRRRLALQQAAVAGAVAVRAPAGTAPVDAGTLEGHRGTRASVYAVQVRDEQEEPEKL
jgi:hypothetical protein